MVFTAAINGAVFARHGTSIDTRLTVIDKLPADDPSVFPASAGTAPDVVTLLGWIESQLPLRLPVSLPKVASPVPAAAPKTVRGYLARAAVSPICRRTGVRSRGHRADLRDRGLGAARGRAPVGRDLRRICAAIAAHSGRTAAIRPNWCNPLPWPLSHRPSRPTAPCCPLTSARVCQTPSLKR